MCDRPGTQVFRVSWRKLWDSLCALVDMPLRSVGTGNVPTYTHAWCSYASYVGIRFLNRVDVQMCIKYHIDIGYVYQTMLMCIYFICDRIRAYILITWMMMWKMWVAIPVTHWNEWHSTQLASGNSAPPQMPKVTIFRRWYQRSYLDENIHRACSAIKSDAKNLALVCIGGVGFPDLANIYGHILSTDVQQRVRIGKNPEIEFSKPFTSSTRLISYLKVSLGWQGPWLILNSVNVML